MAGLTSLKTELSVPVQTEIAPPNRAETRTLKLRSSLRHLKAQQRVKLMGRKAYRNPIALAKEWQAALESGDTPQQSIAKLLPAEQKQLIGTWFSDSP